MHEGVPPQGQPGVPEVTEDTDEGAALACEGLGGGQASLVVRGAHPVSTPLSPHQLSPKSL